MSCIYPVILSGGVGSRLWPLSRSQSPKQLLALTGEQTLIQQTALRVFGPGFAKPSIVCHADHRFVIAHQMQEVGVTPENIFLEPIGRNTAPAAAVSALAISEKEPHAILLVIPADHVICDQKAFLKTVNEAHALAKQGYLVTFGITPTEANTGYGYIQRGAPLNELGTFAVSRFVEKPDMETAARYVQAGDYYWNSGIFMFEARAYLSELERCEPSIVEQCRNAIHSGRRDLDFYWLAREGFEACKSISIDYAVMERTAKAAVVPTKMGWSDIGSWAALWENSDKDADGNVIIGDVMQSGTHNSYLRSEGPMIAVLGATNLIVVASPDAILVGTKAAAQDVKKIVEQLERDGRDLHVKQPGNPSSAEACSASDRDKNLA
jgi:mannose-1-phosphate guanylyltransferase/mannose-6-phosphate isomerase